MSVQTEECCLFMASAARPLTGIRPVAIFFPFSFQTSGGERTFLWFVGFLVDKKKQGETKDFVAGI